MGHVIGFDQVEGSIESVRQNKRLVFTNGCFDLLHVGHVRYLKEARKQGDLLFLGLNTDESVKRLKGVDRPLQPEDERAEILASLECVDFVCLFSEDTPLQLIKKLKPDVLVKGGDWKVEQIVGSEIVLGLGGEVKSLQFIPGKSSSHLIEKIQNL